METKSAELYALLCHIFLTFFFRHTSSQWVPLRVDTCMCNYLDRTHWVSGIFLFSWYIQPYNLYDSSLRIFPLHGCSYWIVLQQNLLSCLQCTGRYLGQFHDTSQSIGEAPQNKGRRYEKGYQLELLLTWANKQHLELEKLKEKKKI